MNIRLNKREWYTDAIELFDRSFITNERTDRKQSRRLEDNGYDVMKTKKNEIINDTTKKLKN